MEVKNYQHVQYTNMGYGNDFQYYTDTNDTRSIRDEISNKVLDSNSSAAPKMSKEYQYKKVMKPMLERKRRARINESLTSLRNMVSSAFQNEGKMIPKLEKADVLELTVQYLQNLLSPIRLKNLSEETCAGVFRSGYSNCAQEVSRYMAQQGLNSDDTLISTNLLSHLSNCINRLNATPTSYIVSMAKPVQDQSIRTDLEGSNICNNQNAHKPTEIIEEQTSARIRSSNVNQIQDQTNPRLPKEMGYTKNITDVNSKSNNITMYPDIVTDSSKTNVYLEGSTNRLQGTASTFTQKYSAENDALQTKFTVFQ